MVDGEVVESDPPRKLVQTYRFLFNDATRAEGFTRLTWEIEPTQSGFSRLTVTHELEGAPLTAEQVGGSAPMVEGGGGWAMILSGLKTFISNAGIAGMYTVLARTGDDSDAHRGLSMFLVDAEAPGISVKALEPMAAHPLGEVRFDATPGVLLGEEGQGYALVLKTLDTFRPSVGAAACGLAARALDEALRFALARRQFGSALSEFQGVQMALADMQTELQAARLLVRQAAWAKDGGASRIPREGGMAKLFATEMAQRVVDRAVQIHGGQGVMRGATVERLYREVRALRIYEGTSEIQKLVIARQMIKESR